MNDDTQDQKLAAKLLKLNKIAAKAHSEMELLTKGRVFKKDLESAVYSPHPERVRVLTISSHMWYNYPDECIPSKYQEELIQLSQAAYEPHDPEDEILHPEKYIELGSPVGWALKSWDQKNQKLWDAVKKVRIKNRNHASIEDFKNSIDKKDVGTTLISELEKQAEEISSTLLALKEEEKKLLGFDESEEQ